MASDSTRQRGRLRAPGTRAQCDRRIPPWLPEIRDPLVRGTGAVGFDEKRGRGSHSPRCPGEIAPQATSCAGPALLGRPVRGGDGGNPRLRGGDREIPNSSGLGHSSQADQSDTHHCGGHSMTDEEIKAMLNRSIGPEPDLAIDQDDVMRRGRRKVRTRWAITVGGLTTAIAAVAFGATALAGGFTPNTEPAGPPPAPRPS